MTTGTNPREFVRLLTILYKVNGLPTFIVPEEVYNTPGSTPATDSVEDVDSTSDDDSATTMQTSDPVVVPSARKSLPPETPTSTTIPVTNRDITVNAATLLDLLSAPAPHVSPAVASPSPVPIVNSASVDPGCDPVEGLYYEVPSAAVPTAATQPSRTLPLRTLSSQSTTSALHSSDESHEDVSVGTPSPPSRVYHYSPADFL
ncbi:calphotin-like [Procambarus clarkii]|uniref:calphotin-like n=1 Tax=Procambarus clarkii TaxID=6728 RepID=UPI001E674358|nr:flocculation protein FLO11-like [Procambarus clarkii]